MVAAAPDPAAPGSSSFPTPASYRDLGQDPSLALSVILFLPSRLGVHWMLLDISECEF